MKTVNINGTKQHQLHVPTFQQLVRWSTHQHAAILHATDILSVPAETHILCQTAA